MAFKVTARTLLQLGSELISSDAVAFYELIKNAFDAQSATVVVRVVKRLSKEKYEDFMKQLRNANQDALEGLKNRILQTVIHDAYKADDYKAYIRDANSVENLLKKVERANYILFSDKGEGMSLEELDSIYLTIGTRSRQKQRQIATVNSRPILGEKGIGRLSVMRLGDGLKIVTTKSGELTNNELNIDWSIFSHNSDDLLETIEVAPNQGTQKEDPNSSGSRIYIYKLNTDWTADVLQTIANEQLSKFIDPFQKLHRSFIKLWFNTEPIIIPTLTKLLFENYHAYVEGQLTVTNGVPILSGSIDYDLYQKKKTFSLEGTHLASVIKPLEIRRSGKRDSRLAGTLVNKTTLDTLVNLGSFSYKFYWFNNRIVKEIEGIGKIKQVRDLIKAWAGGLMVYRDGFRVFPYGSLEDDWLQLDPIAFGAGGYKVNRRQVIGKVDISSQKNPSLIDQTNREGLRDCPEKGALIQLLQYVLWDQFRTLLDAAEDERLTNTPLNLEELEARLERNEQKLHDNLEILLTKFPQIGQNEPSINAIKETLSLNKRLLDDVRSEKESVEQRMEVTLHLAGLGLMVDIIAHEINRSAEHTLSTLDSVQDEVLTESTRKLLNLLGSQLKTLQSRLKILDPLSPSGRQSKETFNIYQLVSDIFLSHQVQFERHNIQFHLEPTSLDWSIKAVKGMFVQILENLIANSVYWLEQEKVSQPSRISLIKVYLDKVSKCIYFTDNGPGIPVAWKEDIFLPFVTTKPPGQGKGLGLFISREIAKYHGASLNLSEVVDVSQSVLHTFILNLEGVK
ncbi:sensor histidine kinase [Spirosoma sp. BT702]|uniref:histidine kinase n=1 Tax=Spirosoma profusum TaxID=2771354 RepID=A0A927AV28_9BACT|nr:sensor histidine kinase [Spirosoma profusum]MBD2704939.1 sensor histidine kinase [Spirosoma profusum]